MKPIEIFQALIKYNQDRISKIDTKGNKDYAQGQLDEQQLLAAFIKSMMDSAFKNIQAII